MYFNVTKSELHIIDKIAERAVDMYTDHGYRVPKMDFLMDLTACVANGCPLKLDDLLQADDSNFAHDVAGIRRHINRETGKLEDCFLPRFAITEGEGV